MSEVTRNLTGEQQFAVDQTMGFVQRALALQAAVTQYNTVCPDEGLNRFRPAAHFQAEIEQLTEIASASGLSLLDLEAICQERFGITDTMTPTKQLDTVLSWSPESKG